MRQIRHNIFETNSSSTHSISLIMNIPDPETSGMVLRPSGITIDNCDTTIKLMNKDDFMFAYGDNIYDKLALIFTDAVMAHDDQREECLQMLDKLFDMIEQRHGKRFKYSLDELKNDEFLKEWDDYTDGNDNPFLCYPLEYDSDISLIEYLQTNKISELEDQINKTEKRINERKMFIDLKDQYSCIYEEECDNEKAKIELKFMKSGHKWNWNFDTHLYSDNQLRIKNLRHLYELVIDDRFTLTIERD